MAAPSCGIGPGSISPSRWIRCPALAGSSATTRSPPAPDSRAYRISVKREARPVTPPGIVSNWLHDHASPGTVLKVAPPAGEFFLDEKDDGPVVLLSGGVGLTPMMSMLEAIVASGSGRPTWYVHGAENGRMHAMGAHARELAAKARNMTVRTFYNAPDPQDVAGQSYDERGVITARLAAAQHAVGGCRLTTFVVRGRSCARMVGGLARSGAPLDRIRYEFFGPADELLAA